MRHFVDDKFMELVQGDITEQRVGAIVNAANSALAGGSGVDGAIHDRGGPSIMRETAERYPDGCSTGSAVITTAGDLEADYVIHAVGPIWRGGNEGEAERLENAYRKALTLAAEQECLSIALPSLSTGSFRFPTDQAARIALRTAQSFLDDAEHRSPRELYFVLFDAGSYGAFAAAMQELRDE